MIAVWGASLAEPNPLYVQLGAAVRAAREACGMKLQTVAGFIGARSADVVYQMERGIRCFPVPKLFDTALAHDADAQRFKEAVICAIADAWHVEDRDGIARRLREVNVAFAKRMVKASLTPSGAHKTHKEVA